MSVTGGRSSAYSTELSASIVRAMLEHGLAEAEVAGALGEDGAFVRSALGGKRKLTKLHARRLLRQTGASAEQWAVRGLDRSGLKSEQARFLRESAELIGEMDELVKRAGEAAGTKRSKSVAKAAGVVGARRAAG